MMDLSSGLMTATGLGVFIYLKDQFSKQARLAGAEASMLSGKFATAAASINSSAVMIGGGLALAGAGIAGLKISSVMKQKFEEIDQFGRDIEKKGFGAKVTEGMKNYAYQLSAQMGGAAAKGMEAAVIATDYGVTSQLEMVKKLRPAFESAIGSRSDWAATTKGLLSISANLGESDIAKISGMTKIAADEAKVSFDDMLATVATSTGQMKLYGASLEGTYVNLMALSMSGKGAGENISNLMQLYKVIQAPGDKAMQMMEGIAGGMFRQAIAAGQFDNALDLLSGKLATVPATMRAAFMREIGVMKPGAQEALSVLVDYAGEREKFYRQLSKSHERHMSDLDIEFQSYGYQSKMLRNNFGSMFGLLGEGASMRDAGMLVGLNKLLAGVNVFLATNPKMRAALGSWIGPASRLAVIAGLGTAGIGLLRSRLVKAGIAAAEGGGMFKTLGLGVKTALTSMLPLTLTIAGIAVAFKTLQWAYRSNIGGFGDWVRSTIDGTLKVAKAVAYALSKENIVKENGKAWATIPGDLARELEKAGLLNITENLVKGAWDVRAFGTGLAGGMKDVFGSTMFTDSVGVLGSMMGASVKDMLGIDIGGMKGWFGAGKTTGELIAGFLGVMTLGVLTISATTLAILEHLTGGVAGAARWAGKASVNYGLNKMIGEAPIAQNKAWTSLAPFMPVPIPPPAATVAAAENAVSRAEQSAATERLRDAILAIKFPEYLQSNVNVKIGQRTFAEIITELLASTSLGQVPI